MLNDHTTIRSTAVFDLVGPPNPPVPVQVEMRYDTRDPYAVQAAFRTGRAGWVEWVFSRDLLTEGLLAPAGAGDVRIRPAEHDAESVEIELSSPSGHATFRTGSTTAVEWVFARDLLHEGLIGPAGTGDVRVQPAPLHPGQVQLELSSPSGYAVFMTCAQTLGDFLQHTYRTVPPETEYSWLDFDVALSDLLNDPARD